MNKFSSGDQFVHKDHHSVFIIIDSILKDNKTRYTFINGCSGTTETKTNSTTMVTTLLNVSYKYVGNIVFIDGYDLGEPN